MIDGLNKSYTGTGNLYQNCQTSILNISQDILRLFHSVSTDRRTDILNYRVGFSTKNSKNEGAVYANYSWP